MAEDPYDLIVIGSGPGGYVAAVRAAQLGLKTAVAEKDFTGGRCLNYACMPAKTILHAAEVYHQAEPTRPSSSGSRSRGAASTGTPCRVVVRRSARVSPEASPGSSRTTRSTCSRARRRVKEAGTVTVGDSEYATKNMLLATGSVALPIPGVEFGERVIDTWGAWSLPEMPAKIAVVGAGASGAEIASAYGRFGVEVLLDRDARPDSARRGQGHGSRRRPRLQEPEHHDLDRDQGRERRGRQGLGQVHLRGRERRGRLPDHRRRSRARRRARSGSKSSASRPATAARSRSTAPRRLPSTASTRSGTSSPGRRWRTRPPTRA